MSDAPIEHPASARFRDAIGRCSAAQGSGDTDAFAQAIAELGLVAWNLAHALDAGLTALAWAKARRIPFEAKL